MWRCQPLGMRRSACHHPWPTANRAAERVAHLPAGARGLVWLTPALRTCDYQKLPSDYLKRSPGRACRALGLLAWRPGSTARRPQSRCPVARSSACRAPGCCVLPAGIPCSGRWNAAFWHVECRDGRLMGPCGLPAAQEVLAPRREVSAPRGRRCPGGVCCPRADVPGRPGLFPE
jgi:hypothetical protein